MQNGQDIADQMKKKLGLLSARGENTLLESRGKIRNRIKLQNLVFKKGSIFLHHTLKSFSNYYSQCLKGTFSQ